MTRIEAIERAAALLFGRDPATGGPEKGWKAKLARALGVGNSAITETMAKTDSMLFDRKLGALLMQRREQMHRDAAELYSMVERIAPTGIVNSDTKQEARVTLEGNDALKRLIEAGFEIVLDVSEDETIVRYCKEHVMLSVLGYQEYEVDTGNDAFNYTRFSVAVDTAVDAAK